MQHVPALLPFLHRHRADFDAVLFDIDGTLVDRGHALPGAAQALAWLRRCGLPQLCLTNDGNHSVSQKAQYLAHAGLEMAPEDIVSCAHAILEFAERAGLAGGNAFILGDLGVSFPPLDAPAADLSPAGAAAAPVFRETRDPAQLPLCQGVIVGEGTYDWLGVITAVFNFFVRQPQAFLLVPNPDSYWPNGHHGLGIGAGAVARFLQQLLLDYGIDKPPTYLGKPHPPIFQRALHLLRDRHGAHVGVDPARILVVGDSLTSDIQGANAAGCRSALVLTGITRPRRLEHDCGRTGIRPWLVVDQLADAGA